MAVDADWERPADKASRNFKNQFEIPVLFYAVTAFALITRNADPVLLILAWLFVLSRIAHTAIHLFSEHVMARALAYFGGLLILVVMWVILAVRVFAAGF